MHAPNNVLVGAQIIEMEVKRFNLGHGNCPRRKERRNEMNYHVLYSIYAIACVSNSLVSNSLNVCVLAMLLNSLQQQEIVRMSIMIESFIQCFFRDVRDSFTKIIKPSTFSRAWWHLQCVDLAYDSQSTCRNASDGLRLRLLVFPMLFTR